MFEGKRCRNKKEEFELLALFWRCTTNVPLNPLWILILWQMERKSPDCDQHISTVVKSKSNLRKHSFLERLTVLTLERDETPWIHIFDNVQIELHSETSCTGLRTRGCRLSILDSRSVQTNHLLKSCFLFAKKHFPCNCNPYVYGHLTQVCEKEKSAGSGKW